MSKYQDVTAKLHACDAVKLVPAELLLDLRLNLQSGLVSPELHDMYDVFRDMAIADGLACPATTFSLALIIPRLSHGRVLCQKHSIIGSDQPGNTAR